LEIREESGRNEDAQWEGLKRSRERSDELERGSVLVLIAGSKDKRATCQGERKGIRERMQKLPKWTLTFSRRAVWMQAEESSSYINKESI
jgi:hypothetical protein